MRSQDVGGFLIAGAFVSTPTVAITCLIELTSKEPIGLAAYLLPVLIGMVVSLPFSVAAFWVGHQNPNPFYLNATAGIAAGLFLTIASCAGGGVEWCHKFSEQFRS